jgi:hypothetical protein
MAITSRLVDLMGGSISVSSKLNEGSDLSFDGLPYGKQPGRASQRIRRWLRRTNRSERKKVLF